MCVTKVIANCPFALHHMHTYDVRVSFILKAFVAVCLEQVQQYTLCCNRNTNSLPLSSLDTRSRNQCHSLCISCVYNLLCAQSLHRKWDMHALMALEHSLGESLTLSVELPAKFPQTRQYYSRHFHTVVCCHYCSKACDSPNSMCGACQGHCKCGSTLDW